MLILREALERQVHRIVGFGSGEIDLDRPAGDRGLFGPDSVAWKVHADFTTMMVGGIGALLLQALHPGALAGVWDHSNFRYDMQGRLRRTAQFISGTTYGSTAQAERLIARVRGVHSHVRGTLPDGTPYSADDADLLTWVHVAEVTSFLRAYLRYRNPALGRPEQDRYFAETARIAERLGAAEVPRTRHAVETYLREIRSQLRYDERTAEVTAALLRQPAPNLLTGPFMAVVMQAGVDLLPEWAARMHGFRLNGARRLAADAGVRTLGSVLRWALRDGSARRARRRLMLETAERKSA
jgi:uncharacterized protein (DUF2236 family)